MQKKGETKKVACRCYRTVRDVFVTDEAVDGDGVRACTRNVCMYVCRIHVGGTEVMILC